METGKYRSVTFYKNYFDRFFAQQEQKVKDKIIWTLRLIEELPRVPETYLKHLTETDGLYEIRIQTASDISPRQEIARALKIKKEYYEEK